MIVILTDFGVSEYVGVMKGVISSLAEAENIVDLCNTVSAQNIVEGSWILSNNFSYFPKGSIFLCVVDPGVGTSRKIVAVRTGSYHFVGPDNGLLWESVRGRIEEIRQIPVPKNASNTFHGRDVMAKAAAEISVSGFSKVGRKIKGIMKLDLRPKGRQGMVVRIDSFGNIITNIKPAPRKKSYEVAVGVLRFKVPFFPSYSKAKKGLFCITGSNGTLELSVNGGSARAELAVGPGDPIGLF